MKSATSLRTPGARPEPEAAVQSPSNQRWSSLSIVTALALSALSGGASAQEATASISGTWKMSCTTKKGVARASTLQIEQSGSSLSGSAQTANGSEKISGSVSGAQVSISGGRFSFNGTFDGKTIGGQNQRGLSFTANRE